MIMKVKSYSITTNITSKNKIVIITCTQWFALSPLDNKRCVTEEAVQVTKTQDVRHVCEYVTPRTHADRAR